MRSLLLHLIFVLLSVGSLAYIGKLSREAKLVVEEKSIARDIRIKVFGEGGEEWKVEGRELVSFGKEIHLLGVLLRSASGYVVKADSITLLKDKNRGELKGEVEIRGEALFVKTERAMIDFNRNLLWGDGKVMVWKESNYIEGRGFRAYLNPLRVIIGSVKTKHEV